MFANDGYNDRATAQLKQYDRESLCLRKAWSIMIVDWITGMNLLVDQQPMDRNWYPQPLFYGILGLAGMHLPDGNLLRFLRIRRLT